MPIEFFDFENAYAVFSNRNYATRRHTHYALEIVCSTEGSFTVGTDGKKYENLQAVIIPPNLAHSFSCLKAACHLLFLDPLSPIGSYFMRRYGLVGRKDVVSTVSKAELFHGNDGFDLPRILVAAKNRSTEYLDSRIVTCIQAIEAGFTDERVGLPELAGVSFLSEGRLAHLFKEQLGISVHQYVLWKKIILAVSKSRSGSSLTACAHAVGFADSAHFSKAFVKMFGIKPFFVLKS